MAGMLAGGDSGEPVVVAGRPRPKSTLSLYIEAKKKGEWEAMPPKENDKLEQKQVNSLESWIESGAHWPSEKTQQLYIEEERSKKITDEGVIVETSGGLSEDWTYRRYKPEDLWAFEKNKNPKDT